MISKVIIQEQFEIGEVVIDMDLTAEILYDRRDGTFLEHITWDKSLYTSEQNIWIENRIWNKDIMTKIFTAFDEENKESELEAAI